MARTPSSVSSTRSRSASSSPSCRLDILGFPEDELRRFRKLHRRALRHGAGHGTDRQRQDHDALRGALRRSNRSRTRSSRSRIPVEYQLRGITQIPINEKKGLTFARGLRSILRHDPDKIMVGEIRDPETAQIAIQSALTGHLVFTTVHANNVLDVLGRFLNMGVEPYQFVSAPQLRARAAARPQHLRALQASGAGHARSSSSRRSIPSWSTHGCFFEGAGCIECGGTGFKGRTAICELPGSLRQHPRNDSRHAAIVRDQEGRARRGHALPPRVRGRARAAGRDDAARDQQGDVRRMSTQAQRKRATRELAGQPASVRGGRDPSRHVAAVAIAAQGGGSVIPGYARRAPRRLAPSSRALNAVNIHDAATLTGGIRAALDKISPRPRRVALVLPTQSPRCR